MKLFGIGSQKVDTLAVVAAKPTVTHEDELQRYYATQRLLKLRAASVNQELRATREVNDAIWAGRP